MNRADYIPLTLEQLLKEVMRRFNNELPPVRDAGPCFTIHFSLQTTEYAANGNTIRDVYTELLVQHDRSQLAKVKNTVKQVQRRVRKEAA